MDREVHVQKQADSMDCEVVQPKQILFCNKRNNKFSSTAEILFFFMKIRKKSWKF